MNLKEKKRKCKAKGCRKTFKAISSLQKACSPDCAMKLVRESAEKEKKLEWKERKKNLKTRREYEKEAQHEFNLFIRTRDKDKPCISCGRDHSGQYHAGHYLPTSSHPELRFCETNVHKQCAPCNTFLSGNLVEYRKNLIQKIGEEEVLRLEGPHEPLKLSVEGLIKLRDEYRVKIRALKWNKTEEAA